ncbi:MAG: Cna B-type domain-containing protein [Coriobacteriales bacterium]
MVKSTVNRVVLAFAISFVLAFALAVPGNALASGTSDDSTEIDVMSTDCSLTMSFVDTGAAFDGVTVRVWKIAEFTSNGTELISPFSESGVSLLSDDGTETFPGVDSHDKWSTLAASLYNYAVTNDVPTIDEKDVDDTGVVVFEDIDPAVYLVVPVDANASTSTITFSPSIVSIPTENDSGELEYNVVVTPKWAPNVDVTEYSVVKHWDDSGYESSRPTSVTVTIARDGEEWATVELSSDNDWTYSWTTETGYEWTVSETIGDENYTYSVTTGDDGTFVITNTYNETETPPGTTTTTTTTTSNSWLPKTMDAWISMIVLAMVIFCVAFVPITAAVRRRRATDDAVEDNDDDMMNRGE